MLCSCTLQLSDFSDIGTMRSFCDLNLKGSLPMIVAWRSLCNFIDMQSVDHRWS